MKHVLVILIVILQVTFLNAKEQREIILYGKVDPRLYVTVWSTYRSMDPKDIRKNFEECSQYNIITQQDRRVLDYIIKKVVPDENGEYETIIPIDYSEDNLCGFEYVDTQFTIRRDKKDELYSKITVAGSNRKTLNIYRGRKGGYGTLGKPIKGENTDKNHYQMSSGSKIECYTKHYIRGENRKKFLERVRVLYVNQL